MPHTVTYRVYYEDTDAAGVMYYANYLKFAERARTEALREAGHHQRLLLEKSGIAFAVRRVEVDYLKPARLDDEVLIETVLQELRSASMTMQQILKVGEKVIAEALVKIACVSSEMKPSPIPDEIKTSLQNILE